jgi:integrase
MPKHYREDEEPLDISDIRKILLPCNNRRLKSYLLILASSGLRATEACALRLCDIDFSVNPTKIHVRKEYSKTKVSRDTSTFPMRQHITSNNGLIGNIVIKENGQKKKKKMD